jgi:hypothetical protein
MLNPFKEVDWNPDKAQKRKFAISLIVGFPVLALLLLLFQYLRGLPLDSWSALRLAGSGAAAGVVFLAVPSIVRPFYVAWYFVACCIGLVVGNVLMALVFYLFVAGLGLLMRAAGRRAMRKGIDKTASTYWLQAAPAPDPKRYYRQF